MKVFELAKDLDIGAIDLLEKLKSSGMNIRNHMVSLSEPEIEQARQLFKTVEPSAAPVKKKVVKKKAASAAKNNDAENTSGKSSDVDVKVSKEAGEKKKVVKKKIVTVKRKTKKDIEEQKIAEVEAKVVTESSVDSTNTISETSIDGIQTQKPKGLQVVFDPNIEKAKLEETEKQNAAAEANEVAQDDDEPEELFKEKMHTFTPVYVPPVEESSSDDDDDDTVVVAGATGVEGSDEDGDGKSKKRIGNLASMVAKKGAVGKANDITMLRANEELKIATTLVGQAVYIPAKRKKMFSGATKNTEITEVKDAKRVIQLHKGATAGEIAQKLSQKFSAFADAALAINLLLKEDDFIGITLAQELAALYDYRVEDKAFNEDKLLGKDEQVDKSKLPLRNPIITVMGHVDHGKTTLLDHIRNAKIASSEAGGITQHIGAYSVKVKDGVLTFLDTPGHAAFGAMRQRGADLTDIVILVVAADDGVMPQTIESIKFIKKAGVPVIVAVNKMDKDGANPDKIKQRLTEYEITPEEWGGDTQFIEISALKGDGVDNLLEAVHLQAEIMDLRETDKGSAEGVVIESKIESGRGPVATILVKKGTLNKGDSIVVGESYGRVRNLVDFSGKEVKSAGPSMPVQVLGLNDVASPGDDLDVVKNEREAKKIVDNRIRERAELASVAKKVSLEDFFSDSADAEAKTLNLIIRSDVQGSFEAIKTALETLGNNEVKVNIIGGGVGAITDNDVMMASAASGYIFGFNMRPMTSARKLAEQKGVDIKSYSIIYELINDVQMALEGLLDPERIEKFLGRAQVKETFNIPKIGVIAGSYVIDGKIERGCNIRLLRDERIIFDGKMSSLKRFKDDAKEVTTGYECGISLDGFNDIRKEDIFEAYMFEERKRKLESNDSVL